MRKLMKALKRRERKAYPRFMHQLKDIKSWSDLQDYCESDQVAIHLLGDSGYLLLTEDEVVDWVATPKNLIESFRLIKAHFGSGKKFEVDLRESTSWRIVKVLQKRKKIRTSNVQSWTWENETMFEATLEIL